MFVINYLIIQTNNKIIKLFNFHQILREVFKQNVYIVRLSIDHKINEIKTKCSCSVHIAFKRHSFIAAPFLRILSKCKFSKDVLIVKVRHRDIQRQNKGFLLSCLGNRTNGPCRCTHSG